MFLDLETDTKLYLESQLPINVMKCHATNFLMFASDWLVEVACLLQSWQTKTNMADVSPAKSFPENNIPTTPEEVDIVLGKTLNDERKLELIAKLKDFPCLWERSSQAFKVNKKNKREGDEGVKRGVKGLPVLTLLCKCKRER